MSRLAFLATVSLFVFTSLPERAFAQPVFAFIDAYKPEEASYLPRLRRSGLTGGVHVERGNEGEYTVFLGDLARADGGNFQANAYGPDDTHCEVALGRDWTIEKVAVVYCFDKFGAKADSAFTLSYIVYGQGILWEQNVGYASVDQDGELNSDDLRQYNSSGQDIGTTRLFPGVYAVNFVGQAGVTPSFHVTALSWSGHYCKLASFGGSLVGVYCFDETGAFADTAFSVLYDSANTFSAVTEAHVASDAAGTASNVFTESGTVSVSHVTGSHNAGLYTVRFDNIVAGTAPGFVSVTARNSGSVNMSKRCKAMSWANESGSIVAHVRCALANGLPSDSPFVASYRR